MKFSNLWKLLFLIQIKVDLVTYNFGLPECKWPKNVTKSFFSYDDFNGNLIVKVYKIKTYIKILIVFFWFSKMGRNFGQNTRNFLLFFVKWLKKFFFDVFDVILGWQRFLLEIRCSQSPNLCFTKSFFISSSVHLQLVYSWFITTTKTCNTTM